MNPLRLWPVVMSVLLGAGALLSGCGEKITIPEPEGLFSSSPYWVAERFEDFGGPVQLEVAQNTLLVVTPDSLTKRAQNYNRINAVGGFSDLTALCVDKPETLVFVYDRGPRRVSWYTTNNLTPRGSTDVPAVGNVNAMATGPVGVEQYPGATTFLYLADPDSLVVHRYAFDPLMGLQPYGILTRSGSDAARFVNQPMGMVRDSQDSLLVSDADTSRHWVIRFNSYPDLTDITADPDDIDPLRGRAALWDDNSGCVPHPADDYVLGWAPGCGETGWQGGASSAQGQFDRPGALATDGSGRIFVADFGNDRIQVFLASGGFSLLFGNPDNTPGPVSLGVVDNVVDPANDIINYAAFIYVLLEDSSTVVKYISNEQAILDNQQPPELP